MLCQRHRRQQGALLEAQLDVDATRIVITLPRRWVDVVLDSPGELARETAITVSKMERGFFQRGQKKLAKKRGKGSSGSGKKKAKKAKDIVPEGNNTVAGTH